VFGLFIEFNCCCFEMLLGYLVSSLPVAENKGVKRPRTSQVGRERQTSITMIASGTRKRSFMFGMELM
jgi:hypothetical protein